jgi:hypothetical protein
MRTQLARRFAVQASLLPWTVTATATTTTATTTTTTATTTTTTQNGGGGGGKRRVEAARLQFAVDVAEFQALLAHALLPSAAATGGTDEDAAALRLLDAVKTLAFTADDTEVVATMRTLLADTGGDAASSSSSSAMSSSPLDRHLLRVVCVHHCLARCDVKASVDESAAVGAMLCSPHILLDETAAAYAATVADAFALDDVTERESGSGSGGGGVGVGAGGDGDAATFAATCAAPVYARLQTVVASVEKHIGALRGSASSREFIQTQYPLLAFATSLLDESGTAVEAT